MDAAEKPVLEPRVERIARYKAERRRELAERYGDLEELPSKWVRRDGKGVNNPATPTDSLELHSDDVCERVNGMKQEVLNGVKADVLAEPNYLRSQSCHHYASFVSEEGHLVHPGPDAPQLHTRVSVGQLRSSLLQQKESRAGQEKLGLDADQTTSSLDLPLGSEGGRRRTRRYLQGSGGGRKTSERFRTQPITANEMEESTGLMDAEENDNKKGDVKTDDRAKMTVAAKMSLFKELEKSAASDSMALLKPRSASSFNERRTRRGNDHRFLTQPITCEEMVMISAPPATEVQSEEAESVVDGDESCRMSMREKLALFNRLSLPGKNGTVPTERPPERRKQKGARYRTQPITVDEVSLLQKGPIQLPVLSLSPNLHGRELASSINLKPSDVRLSQPKSELLEQESTTQGLQDYNSEPCLKGILKKSRPEGSEKSGSDGWEPLLNQQNGGVCRDAEMCERMEGTDGLKTERETSCVERNSIKVAPWRQRNRNRKEASKEVLSERDPPQEEGPSQNPLQEEIISSVRNSSDMNGTQAEEPNLGRIYEEEKLLVSIQCGSPKLQETVEDVGNKEQSQSPHLEPPQCWEPVYASVYVINTSQYIMCFNQTNMCFEAQEVCSSTKAPTQPQWREKAEEPENELQMEEAEETTTKQQSSKQEPVISNNSSCSAEADSGDLLIKDMSTSEAPTESVSHIEPAHEKTPVDSSKPSDRSFCRSRVPFPPVGPTPCDGVARPEREQDLDVLCQSSTPILSSAVAEHRRAVRPSRRTQGSRNPLRALAAREDIRQDYMGDNNAAEERGQAEKNCKNSSSTVAHHATSSDKEKTKSFPPFSNLMLIHIKGRRQVQVRLVEPSVHSLSSGDCFLLITPEHCILWSGEFANKEERAKALELATFIQSQKDLGCQATQVVHLEEGLNSDILEAADFWSILGGRKPYRGAGAPEEDELFERGVVESNCVYRLVEDRLVPHEQAWASVPSTSLLGSSEVLAFDFGCEVYLWHGRDVSLSRKNVALQLTQQVWVGEYDYSNCQVNPLDPTQCNPDVEATGKGRPSWALLGVVSEDNETALFREKFLKPMCGSRDTQGDAMQALPAAEIQPDSPSSDVLSPFDIIEPTSGGLVEEGVSVHTVMAGVDVHRGHDIITLEHGHHIELRTVSVDTWHVQEFDDSEIPIESTGQLHEGDSYVIRWTYSISDVDNRNSQDECGSASKSKENTALFLWRGRHSSVSGRDTAAFLSIGMEIHEDSQVVVPQGKEPPCFLQLFNGGLVIHKGKREEPTSSADWRLFCVRGELPGEALLLEGECCCSSLRSSGTIVLLNSQQGVLYLWTGCKAHSSTREVSKGAVERLTQISPSELGLCKNSPVKVHFVEEGSEPEDFWTALGQMDRKAYDCMLQDPGKYNFTPRLFYLGASSGKFKAEELQSPIRLPGVVMAMPFLQESLYDFSQPALFLLDNRLEVYLWQRGQPEQTESSSCAWSLWHNERKCAMQTALQYCKETNPRRPPQAYLIFEGSEPLTFTNVFPRWERKLAPISQRDSGQVKLTLVQDVLAQLMKTQYSSEELLRSPLPEGVDPQHLEVYLSDQDFQAILEMKRDEYDSLPSWKQTDLKKSKGLFY